MTPSLRSMGGSGVEPGSAAGMGDITAPDPDQVLASGDQKEAPEAKLWIRRCIRC